MKIVSTDIADVLLIEPRVFADDRGFFYESFNARNWREATGLDVTFVQDNHSRSVRGTLRGLHYQLPPATQGKLVRCIVGEIFDVAVDIRRDSATFGSWTGARLSAVNKRQMWVPEGFAHGFLVLSEVAEVLYKTTDYYAPECERCIAWNDREISITWPFSRGIILSDKDRRAPSLTHCELF
ncbi:MAG: dTDP-4-dehydrorhamnose 3,5-epimerase [Desulfuromonadales bacterium]|jgi:dTDP-4-dehydrorhamnose 3,5-epimerase